MPIPLIWTMHLVFAVSLVLLAIAVFLHVRQTRRRLASIDVDDLKRRLSELAQKIAENERSIELTRGECVEVKIKTKALEDGLREIQQESSRFLNIFKTVLYGFDYIVQGCKTALEIEEPGGKKDEKRITSEGE